MWLPAPVYRNAPYYWTLIGIGLIVVGTVGVQSVNTAAGLACLLCGITSCFWGVHIALYRQGHPERTEALPAGRRNRNSIEDPQLDQTCELNYRPDETLN